MLKVDIFQDGRFIGMLRIKVRWHGIIPIDEDEIKNEIEQRLPTPRKAKYSIAFA